MARHAGAYRSEKYRKEQQRQKKRQEKQNKRQHRQEGSAEPPTVEDAPVEGMVPGEKSEDNKD